MTGLVIRGDGLRTSDVALLGGKARNLVLLQEMGQPVPPFYVISTEAFRRATADAGGHAPKEVPPEVLEALWRAHEEEFSDDAYVAVRSSMAGEDGGDRSFAGVHDSFLFVRGRERLVRAVLDVWASAYGERALAYRKLSGGGAPSAAVIVQKMVTPRSSGVMFTVDPVGRDAGAILVSSLFGAGEGLVSGGLSADTFEIRKETLALERRIIDKEEQSVLDEAVGAGLRRALVPEERRRSASLSDEEALQAARAGLAIEARLGGPQDIEFCFDERGRFSVLQARPVTGLSASGERTVWDNSNIIESYSGVTSPMTFSFIRHAYAIVYRCFLEVMGVSRETVHRHRDVVENMLGLFRGRVYYNLNNWYRLVRLFPGFRYNRQFMESMMGLKEPLELRDEPPSPGFLRKYFVELPSLLRLFLGTSWRFFRIRTIVARFEAHLQRHLGDWAGLDFRARQPHEILKLYREMEDALLWNWKAPIVNDFFVMIFYGTLRKLCQSWCGDATASLQNDLLTAQGGIESAEPARRMLELAREARRDPVLLERLRNDPPERLAREIPADPRFAAFSSTFARYLDVYGLRCMNELKLEEPSLRDRPDRVFEVLKIYLASDDPAGIDEAALERRQREIRSRAEERAFGSLGVFRRWVFRKVLRNARLGVRNRENLRFARTRVYGLLRDMLRAVGDRFAEGGLLDEASDVFYLTLDEVWDFVKGTAVTTDLRGLVALRRREFDAYRRGDPPPDRFETVGTAGSWRASGSPAPERSGSVLRGTACCPGEREGEVVVVRTPGPDLRLSGQILAAERTDPGWVVYYPCISGLLIERGSVLSHSCIVAREMGIPTVVRIPGLLDRLETGRRVRLNGSEGTVELLGEPQRTSSSSNPE